MADVGVSYTLTTPGVDITFNQYVTPSSPNSQYFLMEIRGLESPALRTPMDNVPLGDGGLIHDFWYGPRHITLEGLIWIPPNFGSQDAIVAERNSMTSDLVSALNEILRADGTLSFTPQGGGATSYTVRYEVGLQTPHADNYNSLQFSFGLVAGDPFP